MRVPYLPSFHFEASLPIYVIDGSCLWVTKHWKLKPKTTFRDCSVQGRVPAEARHASHQARSTITHSQLWLSAKGRPVWKFLSWSPFYLPERLHFRARQRLRGELLQPISPKAALSTGEGFPFPKPHLFPGLSLSCLPPPQSAFPCVPRSN